jgi:hypothetical protein
MLKVSLETGDAAEAKNQVGCVPIGRCFFQREELVPLACLVWKTCVSEGYEPRGLQAERMGKCLDCEEEFLVLACVPSPLLRWKPHLLVSRAGATCCLQPDGRRRKCLQGQGGGELRGWLCLRQVHPHTTAEASRPEPSHPKPAAPFPFTPSHRLSQAREVDTRAARGARVLRFQGKPANPSAECEEGKEGQGCTRSSLQTDSH